MTLAEFAHKLNVLVSEGYGQAEVVISIEDYLGDGDVIALDQHLDSEG